MNEKNGGRGPPSGRPWIEVIGSLIHKVARIFSEFILLFIKLVVGFHPVAQIVCYGLFQKFTEAGSKILRSICDALRDLVPFVQF